MTRKGPKSDIFFLSSILYQKSCASNFGPNWKKNLRSLDFHTLRSSQNQKEILTNKEILTTWKRLEKILLTKYPKSEKNGLWEQRSRGKYLDFYKKWKTWKKSTVFPNKIFDTNPTHYLPQALINAGVLHERAPLTAAPLSLLLPWHPRLNRVVSLAAAARLFCCTPSSTRVNNFSTTR